MMRRQEDPEERQAGKRDRPGGRDRLMTTQEVAAYLHCSVSTVRRSVLSRRIPHYRLGKIVRFRRSDIDNWLTMHRTGEPSPELARSALLNPDQLSLFPAPPVGEA